jgi:hypothetical protein
MSYRPPRVPVYVSALDGASTICRLNDHLIDKNSAIRRPENMHESWQT